MAKKDIHTRLENYIESQQSKGKYSFTIAGLKSQFQSPAALTKSIQRLKIKGKIAQVRQGFFVIVPPEYYATGILPTSSYIDSLMKFLKRDYYVALLSAAALQGSSHQQPQAFFVVTKKPYLRDIKNKKTVIHFTIKKNWNKKDIVQIKTNTGFIKASSPELTALDLMLYCDSIGGLNRVATLLDELIEAIDGTKLTDTAKYFGEIATVQRLGFMLDNILHHTEKTELLQQWLKNKKTYPVFLNPRNKKRKTFHADSKWKVIKNASPESDL